MIPLETSMDNVWEKLKSLKGRSWVETKDILNKIVKDIPEVEDIVATYNVNSETLPAEDREIYGVYPKSEPFYLERCKLCSHLLKPSVLNNHYDSHHKRNINNVKKTSFISPGKKKHGRKGNKSASEDDSESVISSEAPSPAVDLQETQSNDSNAGTTRDESIIDVISVDEIPSEESKPPTPGPQDFYEEFAVPYSEEVHVISSTADCSDSSRPTYSNSKSVLKLKISTSKDSNLKTSSSTSLLEAHLLSNTKYNTAGNSSSDPKYRGNSYKFGSAFAKNDVKISGGEQNGRKSEDTVDQSDSWTSSFNQVQVAAGSPKLKTETKISIPISVLPQNVKIIGSLKKPVASKPSQLLTVGQNSVLSLDSAENSNSQQLSSPYNVETDASSSEMTLLGGVKEKSTKSKRNKRSKAKNRSIKNTEFDPDKHCGVLIDENRHCLRSLTCKTHAIALRRAVEGRSKEFDKLLADHRASKEALKEQDKGQSVSSSEPSVSIPILSSENSSGNSVQIQPPINDSDIIKIRVPNVNSNSDLPPSNLNYEKSLDDNLSPKVEAEIISKKILSNLKCAAAPGVKPMNVLNNVSQTFSPLNGEVKPQIYDSDIKISFVCSDMLYKVGGLLYMDRTRQAIRKCMEPLMSNAKPQRNAPKRTPINRQKITDFLQLVKNYGSPAVPRRLRLFEDDKTDASNSLSGAATGKAESVASVRHELAQKAQEELERMKNVLSASTKILNTVASDQNEMKKFRLSARPKRRSDRLKQIGCKKIKQESLSDENYDINTLFSFDKCIAGGGGGGGGGVSSSSSSSTVASAVAKTEELGHHFASSVIASDGWSNAVAFGGGAGAAAAKNGDVRRTTAEHLSNASSVVMDGVSPYDVVYLNRRQENCGDAYAENETARLLQTYKDLENEIRQTVGPNIQELYSPAQPMEQQQQHHHQHHQQQQTSLHNAYVEYMDANGAPEPSPASMGCEGEYKVPMDAHMPSIEETISKNYSLLEEYCKNIPADEFFLDNKNGLEYYENGSGASGGVGGGGVGGLMNANNSIRLVNKNEVIIINDDAAMYANERATAAAAATAAEVVAPVVGSHVQVDNLNFDAQLLNTYLSSISADAATANTAAGEMNYVSGRHFHIPQDQPMSKEQVYEEILTLNKQFQDSAAVNIEKPPTPNPVVYAEAENDEVLKWLF